MKRFFALFITFFTVSLLALGAAYIDGKMRPQHNKEHLWHDTLQRLNELGRQQHHHSLRYQQYAIHAQQAQAPHIATLFRAISFAEEVQCENCKDAIGSLGGLFSPPVEVPVTLTSTHEHLQKVIGEKSDYHDSKMQECISGAMDEGNRYLARMLTWCDASDIKMITLLKQAIATEKASDDTTSVTCYWVCPTCGNIECEQLRTCYCPHCMTNQNEFIRFE